MEVTVRRLLFIVSLLAACNGKDVACTDLAAASVNVTIVDPDGQPFRPDTVTFTVDGGETQDAECMNEACTQFVAGWEIAGDFTVTATLCGSSATAVVTVGQTDDGCHVSGESLQLEVDPAACLHGGVDLSYVFAGYVDGYTTCEDLGHPDLFLRSSREGGPVDVVAVTCDDTTLNLVDLQEGSWTFELATVQDPGVETSPFSASGPQPVEIVGGETATLDLTISCDENGWDDGCGGG